LGETEALGLALEHQADSVLLDDGDARKRAAELKLRFVGVLGILLRAKLQGRFLSLHEEIRRLRAEAHFFVAVSLEAQLLTASGEEATGVPPA
jgi:predicted nucleic acid-binding protein